MEKKVQPQNGLSDQELVVKYEGGHINQGKVLKSLAKPIDPPVKFNGHKGK